jgi:hypothetical protein
MKNQPMRTRIVFRDEETLYVLYYQGKQIYTEKEKLADADRRKIGFERNKSVYFTIKSAEEGIINFVKTYSLNKEDFVIKVFGVK